MKVSNKLLTPLGIGIVASSIFSSYTNAEVTVSATAANMYLWRGIDLGQGDAALSGEIKYSNSGFYTGVWGSSGDVTNGNEYDLFLGYGGEIGNFFYDVSYWSYIYPKADLDFGDVDDLVISLGTGPVGFTVYEALSDDGADARYITLSYATGDYNVLIGQHDDGSDTSEHIQAGYSYNENISFAVSKFLDDDMFDDDVQFLVSYSLDIKK